MNKIKQALLLSLGLSTFAFLLTGIFVDVKNETLKYKVTKEKVTKKLNSVPSEKEIIKNLTVKPKTELTISNKEIWKVKELQIKPTKQAPTTKPVATSRPTSQPASKPTSRPVETPTSKPAPQLPDSP